MFQEQKIKEIARQIRRDIVTMIHAAGSGHPGGAVFHGPVPLRPFLPELGRARPVHPFQGAYRAGNLQCARTPWLFPS